MQCLDDKLKFQELKRDIHDMRKQVDKLYLIDEAKKEKEKKNLEKFNDHELETLYLIQKGL